MATVKQLPLFDLIARLILTGVFVTAALPKIAAPEAFAESIIGYRVIEANASSWVALGLPWLELVCAIGLLTPWLKRASAIWIAFLLAVFIGLHAYAWARGLDISCGCFGESNASENRYFLLIARNTALLATVCYLIWLDLFHTNKVKDRRSHE